MILALHKFLRFVVEKKARELQLLAGAAPRVLLNDTLRPFNLPSLSPEDTLGFMRTVAPADKQREFKEKGSCAFGLPFERAHFFVTVFLQEGHCGLKLRLVPPKRPSST